MGDAAADRFRRMHLIGALSFLPYGVCVDHFQHEVYAKPDASPEERHAMWRRLERHYMPWTDHGDLAYPAKGGRWQAKPHIYNSPFYYIDYTLAQCCAMQFWSRARRDPGERAECLCRIVRSGRVRAVSGTGAGGWVDLTVRGRRAGGRGARGGGFLAG